jgi:hypothetical protein
MATEQICNIYEIWFDPKLIIPACMVLVSSGLCPLLLHKYKLKRDRQEKLFDTRKQEYQQYFKKIEDAAKLAGQDYDKYLAETLPTATKKLYESNNSPEAIVEYQNTLNQFTKSINEGYQKSLNELISLRIVCSNDLAMLLDTFENTYKEMFELQPAMLEEIRQSLTIESYITGVFNFDTPTKIKMMALGTKISDTRNSIIKVMRKELGFES